MRSFPESGSSSPSKIFSRVDLPVPLSPSRAMRSPPMTSRFTWSKSVRPSKDFFSSLMVSTSSPRNSLSPNFMSKRRSLVGLSVVRMRSMRFSMEKARLCSLSLPMNAHRCSLSAASWSCSSLACSFSYCLSFSS